MKLLYPLNSLILALRVKRMCVFGCLVAILTASGGRFFLPIELIGSTTLSGRLDRTEYRLVNISTDFKRCVIFDYPPTT